jgi:prophage regulatory protein
MDLNINSNAQFLRWPDVERITGLSRTTIWRLERDGDFPERVSIGPRAVAWRLGDVQRWAETRVTPCQPG